MRILFWNGPYLPRIGGVEIFTARLAAGLIARGHTVEVVANDEGGGDLDIVQGVKVTRLPLLKALDPASPDIGARLRMVAQTTASAAALKRSFQPDIVHVNLTDAGPFFHLRTLQAHPARTVVTFGAALERQATPTSVTGSLVGLAQAWTAFSNAAAANAALFTGLAQEKVAVIYPGVPAEDFPPRADQAASHGSPLFGCLGRLVEEKGVQVALRALHRLETGRLLVIGDGAYRPVLERLAAELGVEGRVEFSGRVSDADRRRLMASCDALIVPSLHEELFGMVAVEGALVGLPVIASQTGGLAEIVSSGETGLKFAPGDDETLAAHMQTLAADPNHARELGAAGRARALDLYTMDTTIDRYEMLYESLTASGAA